MTTIMFTVSLTALVCSVYKTCEVLMTEKSVTNFRGYRQKGEQGKIV